MSISFKDPDQGMVASEHDFEERFWRRKLDGIAFDVTSKKCFPIEFKWTRDCSYTYEEQARSSLQAERVSSTRASSKASKQLGDGKGGKFSNWYLWGDRVCRLGMIRQRKLEVA